MCGRAIRGTNSGEAPPLMPVHVLWLYAEHRHIGTLANQRKVQGVVWDGF
jgi:hypothetical protein